MKEIKYLKALNDPEENQKMLRKLPRNLAERWTRKIDRWLNKEEQVSSGVSVRSTCSAAYPPFSAFCEFLKKESRIACNPVTLEGEKKDETQRRGRFNGNNRNKPFDAGSFATEAEEVKDSSRQRKEDKKPKRDHCLLCKKAHNLDECKKFAKMSQTEKIDLLRVLKVCSHEERLPWAKDLQEMQGFSPYLLVHRHSSFTRANHKRGNSRGDLSPRRRLQYEEPHRMLCILPHRTCVASS